MVAEGFFRILRALVVIVLIVILLTPKEIGYGFGGDVSPNQVFRYREEKVCIGIRYQIYGGPFAEERCLDCSKTVYCVGIPLYKKCYAKDVDASNPDTIERVTECH